MENKPGKVDTRTTEIAAEAAVAKQVSEQVMETVATEEGKHMRAAIDAQVERDSYEDTSSKEPNDDNVPMGLKTGVRTLSAMSTLQGIPPEQLTVLLENQTNDLQQNLDTLVNWAKANPDATILLSSLPENEQRIIKAFCEVDENGEVTSKQILKIEGINFSQDSSIQRTCTHKDLAQTITGIMKLEHESISYQFEDDPSTHFACFNAIESAINEYQPVNPSYDPTFCLSRKDSNGELQPYKFKLSEVNEPDNRFQILKQEIISANQALVTSNNDTLDSQKMPVEPNDGLLKPSTDTAPKALERITIKKADTENKQGGSTATPGNDKSTNEATSTPSPSPPTL